MVAFSAAGIACFSVSTGAAAQPTAAAVAACRERGIATAVPAFVGRVERLVERCAGAIRDGTPRPDCLADALAELAAREHTAGYRGELRAALDELGARLAAACAGADGVPYDADDVTLEALDGHGDGPGELARPDGQTELPLGTHLDGRPGFRSVVQNLIEQDCLPTEPIDVWRAKPGLERLLEAQQCLALNAALARARKRLTLPAPVVRRLRFDLAPPPIPLDAGVDLLPLGHPDGVNDSVAVPDSVRCPLPGVGNCLDAPEMFCGLRPGAGRVVDRHLCPGPSFACVETMMGPDGVTAADVPRGSLASGTVTVTFTDVDPAVRGDTRAELKCVVEGVRDGEGRLVTTNFAGTCHDGPKAGVACRSSTDCDTQVPPRYFCLDGDEYTCRFDGIRGSNPDDKPACADCLVALVSGPPHAGCGTGGKALCVASTCAGGPRDGRLCDLSGKLACPGGTCRNLRTWVQLTGDEAGFYNRKLEGMGYTLCPFHFRWDLRLDLVDGAGWVGLDASAEPSFFCVPSGSSVAGVAAYIHEPGATENDSILPLGLFVGRSRLGNDDVPCPIVAVPVPNHLSGQHFLTGVGPIIGASGLGAPAWATEVAHREEQP